MKTKNSGFLPPAGPEPERIFKDGLYYLSFSQRLEHNIWYRYIGQDQGWWIRVEGLPYRFRLKNNTGSWSKTLEQHILDYELTSKFLKNLNKVALVVDRAHKMARKKTSTRKKTSIRL